MADLMDFCDALKAMRLGFKVAREQWGTGNGELVSLSIADDVLTSTWCDGESGQANLIGKDILATDWGIV